MKLHQQREACIAITRLQYSLTLSLLRQMAADFVTRTVDDELVCKWCGHVCASEPRLTVHAAGCETREAHTLLDQLEPLYTSEEVTWLYDEKRKLAVLEVLTNDERGRLDTINAALELWRSRQMPDRQLAQKLYPWKT